MSQIYADMTDLGRETDGNEICLGVRFALCIVKAQRLARIEHCSGTVVTPLFFFHYSFFSSKTEKRKNGEEREREK